MGHMMSAAAIGVFDSGVGGLTVVRALRALLPGETIVYLGDTARVPYGTKSADTVRRYSTEALQFLEVASQELWQRRQATGDVHPSGEMPRLKMVVVACNTASAVALDVLRERASVPVIGVIRSAIWRALQVHTNQRIAVMATEGTVRSGAYQRAFRQEAPGVELIARPCGVLAPLVEEGWIDHPVTRLALDTYVGDLPSLDVSALILGCTHYPLLKSVLDDMYKGSIALVDPSTTTAEEVKLLLQKRGWLASPETKGELLCFVTDAPRRFQQIATQFLGEEVKLVEQVGLDCFVGDTEGR
jgi:glutamate racemase